MHIGAILYPKKKASAANHHLQQTGIYVGHAVCFILVARL